ncbi:MAG: tRNA lysidine(34) synthetase TilS [Gammaproteobacteria bacterium]|nr:tRNA lysidine(34) synthetase TilS [Gammaproteobacteria bacterium]
MKLNLPSFKRLFVGLSGGLDSMVLAHACAHIHPRCILIHIHHHLQPEADQWLKFVTDFACQNALFLEVFHVKTQPGPAESIEDFARQARYAFFTSILTEPTDVLCLAHHQDDQVETFFLNLARGSGLNGLTAMPDSRPLGEGLLLRPLLEYSRAELERYAHCNGLSWIQDPSNQDERFDRNFLRKTVLPLLKSRWPRFQDKVENSIAHLQEARLLLDAHLDEMLLDVQESEAQVSLKKMRILTHSAQKLLLQHWFKKYAHLNLTSVHLECIIQDFLSTGNDAAPLFQFHGWDLRRNRQALFLEKTN